MTPATPSTPATASTSSTSTASNTTASTSARPDAASPATGLPGSPALRRLFAQLERRSPALGGLLAERLWFRLPAAPAAAVRAARTPHGGEPFAVQWTHGTLRGRVYGDWGNPTAYLVHGWGGWWQQLGAHVQPLLDRGLCVVTFDAPSHGDSGPGAHGGRSTTFVEMAEALAAVVAEFGRPTVVVAHSAGALAAVHALGLGVQPDSLVLVAAPDGVEGMLPVFTAALGVGRRSREVMVRRAERRVGTPVAELDLLTMAARRPSLPRLLVVHDRHDREAPFSAAVRIADAWHDARLMVTDGCGHRRVLWSPEVVERVASFADAAAGRVRRSSR
ncbi:alpha/beta hydrolase [Pedococcus bigeumensis]|uniref:alpha/beta hydrolase n=1 Tax=Pedococcus bigeumensis TaxID=433644 RepID=UPI002FEDBEEB